MISATEEIALTAAMLTPVSISMLKLGWSIIVIPTMDLSVLSRHAGSSHYYYGIVASGSSGRYSAFGSEGFWFEL